MTPVITMEAPIAAPDSQMRADPRVAIVLVNWNGWRECIECIDTLVAQRHRNFHIFVADNQSDDSSVDHIVAWCAAPRADACWRQHPGVSRLTDMPGAAGIPCRLISSTDMEQPEAPTGCVVTIVQSGGNLGFAGGCNVGIRTAGLAKFDYFWFLNPDTVVQEGALVELLRCAESRPGIGMTGATIRYYDQPDVVQALGGGRFDSTNGTSLLIGQGTQLESMPLIESEVEREMKYVMGASMLVASRFISEVGLLAEDYFLYFEEIDWVMRSRGRFTLAFASRSHIFHKSGTNSSKARPMFSSRFYYRNRLRFVARYFPECLGGAKWSLFTEMLRHLARGRMSTVKLLLSTLLHARQIIADV